LAQGSQVGWARTRTGWLFASTFLGHGREALAVAAKARAILLRHREWLRAAGLELHTAIAWYELGRYDRALRSYDAALALFAQAGGANPRLADAVEIRSAKATANKAHILTLLAEFERALDLHGRARAIFAR